MEPVSPPRTTVSAERIDMVEIISLHWYLQNGDVLAPKLDARGGNLQQNTVAPAESKATRPSSTNTKQDERLITAPPTFPGKSRGPVSKHRSSLQGGIDAEP
jgi:hypothetical protein